MDSRPVTRDDLTSQKSTIDLTKGNWLFYYNSFLLMRQVYWRTTKYQFQIYFDRTWTKPWSRSKHDKSCSLKFKSLKRPLCFWMESILLGHVYHMINNDSITGHTVNNKMIDLFLVLNATFINISTISWRPVLVVEEAGVPGENHRPWVSNS